MLLLLLLLLFVLLLLGNGRVENHDIEVRHSDLCAVVRRDIREADNDLRQVRQSDEDGWADVDGAVGRL